MSSSPSLSEQIGALVDDRLLRLLTLAFPVRIPKPGQPLDALMFAAGQASVPETIGEWVKQARAL